MGKVSLDHEVPPSRADSSTSIGISLEGVLGGFLCPWPCFFGMELGNLSDS